MTFFKKKIIYVLILVGITTPGSLLIIPNYTEAAGCEVVSATFDPYTEKLGLAQDGWFMKETRLIDNRVTIHIKTADCGGQTISVSLTGYRDSLSDFTGGYLPSFSQDVAVLNDRDYIVPLSEQFDINLVAGEEACKLNALPWNNGIAGYSDCQFYITVSTGTFSINYNSRDKEQGNLDFECQGGCNEDNEGEVKWLYAGDSFDKPGQADPASIPPTNTVGLTDNVSGNVSPECMGADGKPVEGCYALYSGFGDILTKQFGAINNFGDFINAIIALAIGIAGVITVGMIMWDGFTYWKADKEGTTLKLGAVKGRIWKRLLGLLLLFTIYTLLRTINPDLLNLTPRIDFAKLDSGEQGDGNEESAVSSDESKDFSTTKPEACKEGFEKVYGFITCKTISSKVKGLIDAAKMDGIVLGGGGFRTKAEQINLRKNNCGGSDNFSIYQKKAELCTPPTAIPGTSRHEQGLALDLTCNGKGIINIKKRKDTEICFNWLKQNAYKYDFKNLETENWHWSIDGK